MSNESDTEYRLLGLVEVWAGGRSIPISGHKPRAMLAVLLIHSGEVVTTERLIDQLWDEDPPRTARNLVHCYVSQIRSVLASAGNAGRLRRQPGGYSLAVHPGQVDLHRFNALVDRARRARAAGLLADAASLLKTALSLWRGQALGGVVSKSLLSVVGGQLDERRLAATEDWVDASLALGRHAELISELRGLVAAYPFRERLTGQLMEALYRSGRPAEALQVYRATVEVLDRELHVAPQPHIESLASAIRGGRPWSSYCLTGPVPGLTG